MEIGKITLFVLAVFFLVAAIEALIIVRWRKRHYDWRESASSLGIAIGQRAINATLGGFTLAALYWFWEHRVLTFTLTTWFDYVCLFVAVEFAYYWQHRISHEVRWFWATHCVHHSPNHMVLSGAVRLGWTGAISGSFLAFAPLMLVGFHPLAVLGALAINLIYQFWLHTELVGRLGVFDWWFNSPSNHRVHHAVNPQYLDRNYGGVLMIFDHLFGTYQRELESVPPWFGLVKPLHSHNPIRIAFHEWINIMRDMRAARSWRERAGFLLCPPGWAPDGRGSTSAQIRQRVRTLPALKPSPKR
jgi:sterol desaturase/sphingolipid hydroxylase (fatty acid hydroxylase superfamily)